MQQLNNMESKELQLIVKDAGLEENKVQTLLNSFGEYFSNAKATAEKAKGITVTTEDQTEQMAQARKVRLELKDIRVNVENTRKELKEQSLREGKAIDGIANVIKALIVPVEEHLEKQEKFADEQMKKREEEKYNIRIELLTPYVPDISVYSLREMSTETFNNLLSNSKIAHNASIEAEIKAEKERIAKEKAEKAEQERVKKENETLKKAAEEREKKAIAEREAQEKLLAQERKAKQDLEDKIAKEKEEREKKEADEIERKRQLLRAPDKEKLANLATQFQAIEMPNVVSPEAIEAVNEIKSRLILLLDFTKEKSNNL